MLNIKSDLLLNSVGDLISATSAHNEHTILIVDDVITTCATIDEIANTLNMSGAKEVYALSFAHTSLDRDFDEDK